MKRLYGLLMAFIILLSVCCGCQGNFGSVDLNDTVTIPEDGIIQANLIKQIKEKKAIGIFAGSCDGLQYEWTVFGSDVQTARKVNLQVQIEKDTEDALAVTLTQKEAFGFSALLSIYLEEKWQAQSATAYAGDKAIASVSLTGSKATVLNLTLDGTVGEISIRPDPMQGDASSGETTNPGQGENDKNPDHPSQNPGKDQYLTDPIPEGKPKPVEPEDQDVDKGKAYTCTFSIECSTILNNLSMLDPEKLEMVPSGGVILKKTTVMFYEGESVFDVLQRLCKEKGIHLEFSWTPIYNSAYIEGIHNLYEFDCGSLSGWMYRVNGWYPNYGCSRYQLKEGDTVEWRYTCDLGEDVGRDGSW